MAAAITTMTVTIAAKQAGARSLDGLHDPLVSISSFVSARSRAVRNGPQTLSKVAGSDTGAKLEE